MSSPTPQDQRDALVAYLDRLRNLTTREALALGDAAEDTSREKAWAPPSDAVWETAMETATTAILDADRTEAYLVASDHSWADAVRAVVDAVRTTAPTAMATAAGWAAGWAANAGAAALIARDLIAADHYTTLTEVAAGVLGPLHPDDAL